MSNRLDRRDFLKRSLAGSAAGALALSLEEQALLAQSSPGKPASAVPAGATGDMPTGKIGNLDVTRLIVGGNLTSGFAHSRDLIYVSGLLRQYFTDAKVFETWELCEQCGINTAILRLDDYIIGLLTRYWNERGGKLQWIAQVQITEKDMSDLKKAVDNGAVGAFIHGGVCDDFVAKGKVDLLAKAVQFIKDQHVVAGVGGHQTDVPIACEKAGVNPDFYMKTLHKHSVLVGRPPAGEGQRLVAHAGKDDRVHERRHEALDCLQGDGRRRDPRAGRLPLRLRERRRLHLCRHVRLPGPRGHDHRQGYPQE